MARYSIIIERENKQDQLALKLKHNSVLQTKFDLEVIDRYLTQFRDQDEFLTKMAKLDALPYIPKKCYIGYYSNGELKEKNIIYNNPTINNAAKDILDKKTMGYPLILTPTPEIKDLIREIKELAVKDDSAFKSMFFSDLFPKHVYDLLKEYRNLKKVSLTSENLKKLEDLAGQIDYNIRKYKLFRPIYLWNKKYKIKQKEKSANKSENNQMNLSDFMDMNYKIIGNKKEVMEDDEINSDDVDSIDENKESIRDAIFATYETLGSEEVLNTYDIDEIVNCLTKDERKDMGLKL